MQTQLNNEMMESGRDGIWSPGLIFVKKYTFLFLHNIPSPIMVSNTNNPCKIVTKLLPATIIPKIDMGTDKINAVLFDFAYKISTAKATISKNKPCIMV